MKQKGRGSRGLFSGIVHIIDGAPHLGLAAGGFGQGSKAASARIIYLAKVCPRPHSFNSIIEENTMPVRLQRLILPIALMACAPMSIANTVGYSGVLPGERVKAFYGAVYDYALIGPGMVGQSQSTLTFSLDMLGFLDTARAAVTGSVQVEKDEDGYFDKVAAFRQNAHGVLWMDEKTHAIEGVSTALGMTLTTPLQRSISTGGSITLQNLGVNLNDHLVYGDILGAHDLVAQSHVALFSFNNADVVMTQSARLPVCASEVVRSTCDGALPNPDLAGLVPYTISLTNANLSFTQQGTDAMVRALGLLGTMPGEVSSYWMIGTLSINADFYALPDYFPAAVPEPGSMALMGLGLIALFGASRRGKAH